MSSNSSRKVGRPVKALRWHHGFLLALPVAVGLFVSGGFLISAIGAIPAAIICTVLSVVALLQNKIYSEMAAMFPDKAGGVAIFAVEAWKPIFVPIAPIAAFGYWSSWCLGLGLLGLTLGSLVQNQWFPDASWILFSVASVDFGLPHLVSAIGIVACSLLNIAGVRVAVRFNLVVGIAFIAVLLAIAIGPFVMGNWSVDNLTWRVEGGWRSIFVWMYVASWAIYATEMCAVFAPEYKNTTQDTARALNSISIFVVVAFSLIPIAAAGQLGEGVIAENPITYGVVMVQQMSGGLSNVIAAILCGAIFMLMNSAVADAGRALYGIASEGIAIKQLDQLNKNGVPSRAIWLGMLINLGTLILIGNPIAILIASNLGYLLSVTLAIVGFVILRHSRPNWPRPIKLPSIWVPIAIVVATFNGFMLTIGALNPGLSYSGGVKEVVFGLCLLLVGVLIYLYRRLVQDRMPFQWRESVDDSSPALQTMATEKLA